MSTDVTIRRLRHEDAPVIAAAFQAISWAKGAEQYEEYARADVAGERSCFVAELGDEFAGYCTLLWESRYAPFKARAIPEISDLNVLPQHRNRGIGTQLMEMVEAEACKRGAQVGLGVGLYADYGAAQRLYVRRGYVPDGRGMMYGNEPVSPGASVRIDDDATLMLTRTF